MPIPRESYAVLDRRRKALLKKIANAGPFIMATACNMKVRCGNPKCKCAKDKEARHEKLHLSWTDAQSHTTQYVPVDLHEEVKKWIENYWTIKEYMKEMTALSRRMIRLYSQRKKYLKSRKSQRGVKNKKKK
jgi:hypothetical protein